MIYINDIVKICPEECSIKMFADDILMYVIGKNSAELKNKMNMGFSIIEGWMDMNKLKLDAKKTKFMIEVGTSYAGECKLADKKKARFL